MEEGMAFVPSRSVACFRRVDSHLKGRPRRPGVAFRPCVRCVATSQASGGAPLSVNSVVAPASCREAGSEAAVSTVSIYDTTLRDGSQGEGISLSVLDKLRIAEELESFGVAYIEGGWPGSNPKDAEFFEAMKTQRLKTAKLTAFGSTRYKHVPCAEDANVKALVSADTPVVTLVGKAWDMQVQLVLETTLEENISMIADTVAYFKALDREVMLDAEHFFDGFRANRTYALETVTAADKAGADVVVLCDTNGGSTPWEIGDIVSCVRQHVSCRIGIHTHNDMELAVANSLAAVRAGASVIQGTANGIGERTGNANLMSIIPALQLKMGIQCVPEDRLKQLKHLSRFVDEQANIPHQRSRPFVGDSAFAHKGGLHVAAMMKNEASYQFIDPALVGNQKRILVSELSGRGNILTKAKDLGLLREGETANDDAWKGRSKKVLLKIKELESKGYTFEGADASVELMIRRTTPDYLAPFELLDFNVFSSNKVREEEEDGIRFNESHSQATVKMCVLSECTDDACPFLTMFECSEGNGPVDALSHAMLKALTIAYPSVRSIVLTDYRVRIIDQESATQATTRVVIEFRDNELNRTWRSVSAHANIIVASVNALLDGFEYGMLLRTEVTTDDDAN